MATALVTHCGAHPVTFDELSLIPAPPPTDTWFPLAHGHVLNCVTETLDKAGFRIHRMKLAVTEDRARFFGTLDLASQITDGVALAVGIRNSTDKSLPIGFCCGSRCFVCDNLAFSADVIVNRKHTRFGDMRFNEGIARAVQGLEQYRLTAAHAIERLQGVELSEDRANSLILQAYEQGIIGARLLPELISEWRHPVTPEFRDRTAWSLLNAFTEVLKDRQEKQPLQAAYQTINLQKLIGGVYGLQAAA